MAKKQRSRNKKQKRSPLKKSIARLTGARLCYGKPVVTGDRIIIPVARVRVAGGAEHGWDDENFTTGSGGGALRAEPVGYIDASTHDSSFVKISGTSLLHQFFIAVLTLKLGYLVLLAVRHCSKNQSGCCLFPWRSAHRCKLHKKIRGRLFRF